MTVAADPCDACVRRSWLVARLAAHLERRRAERSAIRCVLALADEQLLDALGGGRRAVIRTELDRLDPGAALKAWRASRLAGDLSLRPVLPGGPERSARSACRPARAR